MRSTTASRMYGCVLLGVALSAHVGCATGGTGGHGEPDRLPDAEATPPQAAPAPQDPPRPTRTPQELAASFISGDACEQKARTRLPASSDDGWELLVACIRRDLMPDIRTLLDEPWRTQMLQRSEAGQVLAKLVAMRGGDVKGDLKLFHDARVPVFGLESAMEDPRGYIGKHVLIRAAVKQRRTQNGNTLLDLAQTSIRNTLQPGYLRYTTRSRRAETDNIYAITKNENLETGARVTGRLAGTDPYLERGRTFVFLLRFEGARAANARDTDRRGLGTVECYFEPSKALTF